MTQQEFNQMLAVAIAGGLGGGTYISRWDGEQIDDGIDKVLLPGGITATELADGAVTWPKLAVEARPIRRNPLINSCFVGGQFPINQRGQTEYAAHQYGIDGWLVHVGGLTISTSGITIQPDSIVMQRIENFQPYANKVATASVLWDDNTLTSITGFVPIDGAIENSVDPKHVVIFGIASGYGETVPAFYLVNRDSSTSSTALAAKLEEGPNQTLAHKDANGNWVLNAQPHDFSLELMKCRYYYRRMGAGLTCFSQNGNVLIFTFPFDGEMRIPPAVTLLKNNFNIYSGNRQITVQNANIENFFCTTKGAAYITIAGDYSEGGNPSEPTVGEVYRYDHADDLFALDSNL